MTSTLSDIPAGLRKERIQGLHDRIYAVALTLLILGYTYRTAVDIRRIRSAVERSTAATYVGRDGLSVVDSVLYASARGVRISAVTRKA